MNDLPEAIAFEKAQRKRLRTWNYVMGALVVISLAVIMSAIVWAH